MPPKLKKEAPKNLGPVEDETGIPKNEVTFKFSFQVKQTEIENIMIMFEWINASDSSLRQKLDTDLIESWTQPDPADPTVVNFEMELPVYRIEDKFVKNICSGKFYVYFVSTEDQTVKDSLYLHYSPILTAKGEAKFESYHDKIKIPQIESFRLTLTASGELLTPMFRDYLNPLEICIVGAKEMPVNTTNFNHNEPVYIQAKFFDGTLIKTNEVAHASTCKWMYKQVLLIGLMDPVKLKEFLMTTPIHFEVHDQDELSKTQVKDFKKLVDIKYEEPEPPVEAFDPKAKGKGAKKAAQPDPKKKEEKPKDTKDAKGKDAKGKKDAKKKKDVKTFEPIKIEDKREITRTNYGVSTFNLNDLLNPHVTTLKLRNHIVPLQKYENNDAGNLDLNTTAKREVKEAHISCDYITNGSYLVVSFEVAHAIKPFKLPITSPTSESILNIPGSTTGKPGSKQVPAPKPTSSQAKDKKTKPGAPVDSLPTLVVFDEKPIYERAVYIFPYKSPEITPKLLSIVQEINMAAFGQTGGNPLFISTKALTEEEKKNRDLDIITGIEFIDNQYRTFILEGLSDKGMKRLEESFPKEIPNTKDFKIMKNPEVKFKDRLYLDCNIDVKKIRLRENLAKLLTRPEIYLRSKVPENIYNTLLSFVEIRRCDNMKAVVASNLFPDLGNMISMERMYGDALTDEDINGKECPPQKIITRTAMKLSKLGSDLGLSNIQSQSNLSSGRNLPSKVIKEISTSVERTDGKVSITRPFTTKLATRVDEFKHEKYSLQMRNLYPVQDGERVFVNGETKLNIYEKQNAELREIVRNDPNHFYTYSADYLSLSIDPFAPDDIKKQKEEEKKKMWRTQNGFQTVVKKDPKDYNAHPKKPHPSTIDELRSCPWHQDKEEQTKKLTNTRGEAIRNGQDFKLRLKTQNYFSTPEIVEAEKITAVEKERQMKEEKKKVDDEWQSKVLVDNLYIKTSLCQNRNSQLDKIKGIRDGDAMKKGIVMKDSRIKTTTLGTTKTIEDNPISMYLVQEWQETTNKNLFERQLDPNRAVSAYDFKRNLRQSHQYSMVYKPIKEIFPKV